MLISMNLFIKAPLTGAMNFNSYVFKTKIHFKTLSQVTYRIKWPTLSFWEIEVSYFKGSWWILNEFKDWFCYESDIQIIF